MSTPKNAFIENEMIENTNSYSDIIKESSYMFYEFRDEELNIPLPDSDITYKKKISPILSKFTIDNLAHAAFLDIVFEELPFYHKKVDAVRYKDQIHLSYSRDPAITDVPSFLHNSNVWNIWFRESQGLVHNDLLLNIYNKLRHPFVNENQYLNITLFPRLAEKLYEENIGEQTDSSKYSLIEFKTTLKDNSEDIKNGDIGCLDFIEDTVNQKIHSCYSLLDYHPDQAQLLDVWSSSMYWAGTLNEDDLEREKTVYKLQDVKYELLRRKFAGSSTLYSIALSAINRAGSFVNTTNIGAINTSESYKFRDSRLVRLLNLPGILTSTKSNDIDINPIRSFFEIPSEENEQYIDLKLLSPMYYTSDTVYISRNNENSYTPFDSESFYLGDDSFKAHYLRDKSTSIDWNTPESLLDVASKNYTYPKLDTFRSNLETVSKDYLQLDGIYEDISNEKVTCNTGSCSVVGGVVVHNPIHLDIKLPVIKDSAIISSLLDINADNLLYHSNTLQQQLQHSYPYITYPIANGNSVSLMDTFWMNYLESSTAEKSRVQDSINFGTQISNCYVLPHVQTDYRSVFVIENAKNDKYHIDLFRYDIFYTVPNTSLKEEDAFKVVKYNKTHITRITKALKIVDSAFCNNEELKKHDSFELMLHCNTGLLPFTYESSQVNPASLRLGIYEGVVEDDIKDHGLTKAIFVFSDYDNITTSFKTEVVDTEDPEKNQMYTPSEIHSKFSYLLGENTKALYYVVPRYDAEKGITTYYWSSPVNVIYNDDFSSLLLDERGELKEDVTFHPDWFGMCYQLNPQLNFEANSASPLRRKNVFKAPLELDSNTNYYKILYGVDHVAPKNGEGGPSVSAALCNLARGRGYDFLCNDAGADSSKKTLSRYSFEGSPSYEVYADKPWIFRPEGEVLNEKYKEVSGFFLERTLQETVNKDTDYELISIYGDNRYKDAFDSVDETLGLRSSAYVDRYIEAFTEENSDKSTKSINKSTNAYCIRYHKNVAVDDKHNRLSTLINPVDNFLNLNTGSYWTNTTDSGFSVFMHFRLSEILGRPLYKTSEGSSSELSYTNTSSAEYVGSIATLLNSEGFKVYLSFGDSSCALYIGNTKVADVDSYLTSEDTVRLGIVVSSDNEVSAVVINSEIISTNRIKVDGFDRLNLGYAENIVETEDGNKIINEAPFYGCIYDLRLYNRALSDLELIMYNQGTLRELYSYGPSNYVLSNAVYPVVPTSSAPKNTGVLRQNKSSIPSTDLVPIDSIRVFNRGVWDTIIVDTCPLLEEELDPTSEFYSYDAEYSNQHDIDIFKIEDSASSDIDYELFDSLLQELTPEVEISNGLSPLEEAVTIKFNGSPVEIHPNDKISLVTTTLHPTTYSDAGFISEGYLSSNVDNTGNITLSSSIDVNPIEMPINTVGDSLIYKADVTLNLQAADVTNFECYFDAGSNIHRILDNKGNVCIAHKEASITKNTNTNYVLLPLTIPHYEASGDSNYAILNKFSLSNVTLHSIFNELLSSKNYYTEFLLPKFIPSTQYVDLGSGTLSDSTEAYYASKWTGIKTLKPGTYYITCKYPFQIMPFEDNTFNTSDNKSYTVYYGMVRFRLDVKYDAKDYNEDLYGIKGYPTRYRKESLEGYLSSDKGLFDSVDNSTYPHATVSINLYSQRVCDDLKWDLVASNDKNYDSVDNTDVVFLDKKSLQSSILLKKSIDMAFSNNYSMPAYVAGTGEGEDKYDPKKPVLDNAKLKVTFNKAYNEKITASSEEDLKDQVLCDETAYKLLFDYTAKITEFSFREDVPEIDAEGICTGELDYYYKMKSLLTAPTTAMYNETLNITPFVDNNRDYVNKISGYKYQEGSWLKESSDTEYYLGDPNSKSSSYNKLYKDIPGKRFTLNDSRLIPYAVEGVGVDSNPTSVSCCYTSTVRALDVTGAAKTLNLSEFKLIKDHATNLSNGIIQKINDLCSSGCGVLYSLCSFDPYIEKEGVSVNNFHKLGSASNQLQLYRAVDRTNLITNRFSVTRASLFSDNMLYNQNFADSTRWIAQGNVGRYVSDEDKDIYTVDLSKENPLYLKWIPSSSHIINNTYEVAAHCPGIDELNSNDDLKHVSVFVAFLKDIDEDVSKIEESRWKPLGKDATSEDVVSIKTHQAATTIAFKFEGDVEVKISSLFVRTSYSITEKHGLYNAQAPYKTDDVLVTRRHSTLIFRNKNTNSIYPVQFRSTAEGRIRPFDVENDMKNYILEPLDKYSSQPSVIAPWKNLIVYKENDYNDYKENTFDRRPTATVYRYIRKHDPSRRMYVESLDAGKSAVTFKFPDNVSSGIYYDDDKGIIVIRDLQVINDPNSILGRSNLSIVTNTEGDTVQYLPASLSNEKVSGITNCFNVERYLKKETSNIAVTNIQYLDESGDVIYEIEYPPIIYDESKHHLSINAIFKRLALDES